MDLLSLPQIFQVELQVWAVVGLPRVAAVWAVVAIVVDSTNGHIHHLLGEVIGCNVHISSLVVLGDDLVVLAGDVAVEVLQRGGQCAGGSFTRGLRTTNNQQSIKI